MSGGNTRHTVVVKKFKKSLGVKRRRTYRKSSRSLFGYTAFFGGRPKYTKLTSNLGLIATVPNNQVNGAYSFDTGGVNDEVVNLFYYLGQQSYFKTCADMYQIMQLKGITVHVQSVTGPNQQLNGAGGPYFLNTMTETYLTPYLNQAAFSFQSVVSRPYKLSIKPNSTFKEQRIDYTFPPVVAFPNQAYDATWGSKVWVPTEQFITRYNVETQSYSSPCLAVRGGAINLNVLNTTGGSLNFAIATIRIDYHVTFAMPLPNDRNI